MAQDLYSVSQDPYGEDSTEQSDESFVVLDLDTDTVGQALSLLRGVFQQFTSTIPGPQQEEAVTVIAVYACDPISSSRWPHVWQYLVRNTKEFLSGKPVRLLIMFIGSSKNFSDTIERSALSGVVPENMDFAVPKYIATELESFVLDKLNVTLL